ncbi:MAG TPA: NADH-quinone oxidoreductase subunit NuoE [Micrococcales bacterium]|uniref:NADH-quinone oxidoreductase subunit NuoE n=1 Tax=Miniimonas TaxID=947525 RepID=UPI000D525881|nr:MULTISPECIES: NADH-quinone oxidoreductase subunit NuoE [Miniimonas]HCX85366.1 NADH-quinone oxidoreductase subunit NuoE [Micrococcales bacterium]
MTELSTQPEAPTPTQTYGYPEDVAAQLRADAATIIARYPDPRSALLPLLHLVQSVDAFVSPRGIALCAELLDLSRAEVSAVATFYSQYKRKPNGRYTVGVCTNTLCAVMGGDAVYDAVSEHLGIGNDETTPDGAITLERIECNAACDYAPVVMVNWEFFDNVTPERATSLVADLAAGIPVTSSRGPVVQDFRAVSRVLAGFEDGLVDEGGAGGDATLVGLRIAREHGWQAPAFPGDEGASGEHQTDEPDGEHQPAQTGADGATAAGTEPTGEPTTSEPTTDAGAVPGAAEGAAAVGEEQSSAEHAGPIGEAEATGEHEQTKQRTESGEKGAQS